MDTLNYQGKIRARVADEFIKTIDAAAADAGNCVAPLLMIHSELDTMCDPKGTGEEHGSGGASLAWHP